MPETDSNHPNFCTSCGNSLRADWLHCPNCGTARAVIDVPNAAVVVRSASSAASRDAQALIDEGRLDEAEANLRASLTEHPDVGSLMTLADALQAAGRYNDIAEVLGEAKAIDPTNAIVRLRLAQHFGKLGLFAQSKAELEVAQRNIPSGNIQLMFDCQEFSRWLRDKGRTSFVWQPAAPHLPSWLSGLGKHKASPSSETGK